MYEEIFQKFSSVCVNCEFIPSFIAFVLTVIIILNTCKMSVVGMSVIFSLESLMLCPVTPPCHYHSHGFLDVCHLDRASSV